MQQLMRQTRTCDDEMLAVVQNEQQLLAAQIIRDN